MCPKALRLSLPLHKGPPKFRTAKERLAALDYTQAPHLYTLNSAPCHMHAFVFYFCDCQVVRFCGAISPAMGGTVVYDRPGGTLLQTWRPAKGPMPSGNLYHWWLVRSAGEATSEEASRGAAPHEVARSVHGPGHGAWREHPQRPQFISTRDRSTRGRGMGGTGEGDRAATPPLGAPAGPVSTPAAAPTPSP